MGGHDGEVGGFPFHEEDFVWVGTHVGLLKQGSSEGGPLRPLGDFLLGVVLIVGVGVGIEIFQPYREQDIISKLQNNLRTTKESTKEENRIKNILRKLKLEGKM